MRTLESVRRLVARFWYPVTLPEEVAEALGIEVSNFLSFDLLVQKLKTSWGHPTRLARYMPRKIAESAFVHATSVDLFKDKTLVSYYFPQGTVEFVLLFDEEAQLRRVYLQHKDLEGEVEIKLASSYIGHRSSKRSSRRLRIAG